MRNIFQQEHNKYSLKKAMVELTKNTQKSVSSLPLFISLNNTNLCLETLPKPSIIDGKLSQLFDDTKASSSSLPAVFKRFLQNSWGELKRDFLYLKAYRMLNKSPEMDPDFIVAQLILHKACHYLDKKCAELLNADKALYPEKIAALKDELVLKIFEGLLVENTALTGSKAYFLKQTVNTNKPLKVSWMTGATSMFFASLKSDHELMLAPEISLLPLSITEKENLLQIQQAKFEQMRSYLIADFVDDYKSILPENLLCLFKDNFCQLYQLIDTKIVDMYLPDSESTQL